MVFNKEQSYFVTAKDSLEQTDKKIEQKSYSNDDDSEGGTWAAMTLGRIKLNKAKSKSKEFERCLQFKFVTKNAGESFSVQALDLTKIRKISK